MKKHKFKVGDAVYCVSGLSIERFIYCEQDGFHSGVKLCESRKGKTEKGIWHIADRHCHPTPEACAQALVEEFYINNPKT